MYKTLFHKSGHILVNCYYSLMFVVPTMQKLCLYLETLTQWEEFGKQLLPKDKGHMLEVRVWLHYWL